MKRMRMKIFAALIVLSASANVYASALINLTAQEPGMHRISYEQLVEAGVDLRGVRHARLSLFDGDQEVALRSLGERKKKGRMPFFGPGGFLEFYAEPIESQYTTEKSYTLHLSKRRGLNFTVERQKFDRRSSPKNETYIHTVRVEENRRYDFLAPSATDPWHYGQLFGRGATTGPSYEFSLDGLVGNQADILAEVYGIVDIPLEGVNDHHPEIMVNGIAVADQQFDGTSVAELAASDVQVHNGSNTVRLNLKGIAGMPFDAVALNSLELQYPRSAVLEGGYLDGIFPIGSNVVAGLPSGAEVSVYRLDGSSLVRVLGGKRLGKQRYGFNASKAGRYVVVAADAFKTPAIELVHDDQNIRTGSAEYLIITHQSFEGEALDELIQMRAADYQVKVVDVEQIYGQFGAHQPSAEAIQKYIKFAASELGTRFVVLVGSDTYDYKAYISDSISFIPTRYVSTPGGFLMVHQTPSDAKYGDLDDDQIPDIPVGRLSVRTSEELASVVAKIRDYQARVGYAHPLLIAADKYDAGNQVDFTRDANVLINAISEPEWREALQGAENRAWRAFPDDDGEQAAHDKLIAGLNAGVEVATYIGHSSQVVWGSTTPILLTSAAVQNLTNINKPALVTQWGCWNTYFVDPGGNSMGDQFLHAGEAGAVTVLGASTLTTSSGERQLGIELNRRMYKQGATIGEAVVAAKQAMAKRSPNATDILLGWQILGDPALVVNR